MTVTRLAVPLVGLVLLAGCGGGADTGAAPASASPSPSPSRSPSPSPRPSPSPSPTALDPAAEQAVVTRITADTFEANRKALSDDIVKASTLVEAQEDFRFDVPSRTLVVAVTSRFASADKEFRDDVAYSLADDFAPVFWGEQVTKSVRPESTALFTIKVDRFTYSCPSLTMVALANRELSKASFVTQCVAR